MLKIIYFYTKVTVQWEREAEYCVLDFGIVNNTFVDYDEYAKIKYTCEQFVWKASSSISKCQLRSG